MIDKTTLKEDWVKDAVEQYETPLKRYAFYFVHSEHKAEDIVQETFMKLCSADQESMTHLKAWLFKVCRNQAFEYLRKEKKMSALCDIQLEQTPTAEPSPDAQAAEKDQVQLVLEMVHDLPEKQRELVRLKFQHHMSYKEISEIAGLSVSNVGFVLHTALKSLRQKMLNHSL